MWPPSRRCGRQSRVMRIRPWTFVSSTVSSSASVEASNGSRPSARPALLTRMSSAAELGDARSTNALAARGVGDVELERDVRVELLDAPRAAGDAPRPLRAAPARAAPMPLDAPVTIAVLPSSLPCRYGPSLRRTADTPEPLPSRPGAVRWTDRILGTVSGKSGYQSGAGREPTSVT